MRIPAPFASHVLADLVRAGLVTGSAGRRGGYRLAVPPTSITVLRVVDAAERAGGPPRCVLRGMSEFRTVPVAIGTLAAYAMLITGLTARVTKLLPAGWWLKLHRLSLVVLALAWAHGILSGTDTFAAAALYASTFGAVMVAAAYRYWIVRAGRPTFATSLAQEGHR